MAFPGGQPLGAFGNYKLLRRIARGGMAEIFLALLKGKAGFEKVVVLKRVLPELSEVDEFIQIFLDEARLAARLDHPNIGRIYELGEVGGQYYLAMEYLPGEDLASVIQQCRRNEKAPSIEVAAEIALSVCEGLQFAHSAKDAGGKPLGIVHRDISPSNIVATFHGQVKLIDFGIARAVNNIVRTGGVKPKGKVQYMSPEQAAGARTDLRSDIFSAGIVLHELLTTQRLFRRATDEETHRAVINADAAAPSKVRPDVPPALDKICARALAKFPNERYRTADEFAIDLRSALAQRSAGRGTQLITTFMEDLFPLERREKKIRIGQGMPVEEETREVTPVLSFDGLTPIRTNPRTGDGPPRPRVVTPKTVAPARLALPPLPSVPPAQTAPVSSMPDDWSPKTELVDPVPTVVVAQSLPQPSPSAPSRTALQPPRPVRAIVSVWQRPPVLALFAALLVAISFGVGSWSGASNLPPPPAAPAPVVALAPAPVALPASPLAAAPELNVGGLKLNGLPVGTRVTVDGDAVSRFDNERYFAAGKHKLAVMAPGFFPFDVDVEIAAGQVRQIAPSLEKLPPAKGTVEIFCNPWCAIDVDGKPSGRNSPARLVLSTGPHKLRFGNPTLGLAKEFDVRVEANATQHFDVALTN